MLFAAIGADGDGDGGGGGDGDGSIYAVACDSGRKFRIKQNSFLFTFPLFDFTFHGFLHPVLLVFGVGVGVGVGAVSTYGTSHLFYFHISLTFINFGKLYQKKRTEPNRTEPIQMVAANIRSLRSRYF